MQGLTFDHTKDVKMERKTNQDDLIAKLCLIYATKFTENHAPSFYSKPLLAEVENKLKETAYEVLTKHRSSLPPRDDFATHLLRGVKFSTQTAAFALAARLRMKYRRFDDADFVETSVKTLLKDPKNETIVRLLICLSDVDKTPVKHNVRLCGNGTLTRERRQELYDQKAFVQYGDYNCDFPTAEYKVYPQWAFELTDDEPLSFSFENSAHTQKTNGIYEKEKKKVKEFSTDDCHSVFGINSWLFTYKGFTPEYDRQHMTLYGGLSRSQTTSTDIRLTLPDLNEPIDILKEVSSRLSSHSPDEGFFSRPSSCVSTPQQISKLKPLDHDDQTIEPVNHWSKLFEDDQPYKGYRVPNYDLRVWDECLKTPRHRHRTWETLGQPAGSAVHKCYLFECDRSVLDELSFHRRLVIHDFAKFMNRNNHDITISEPKRIYISEALLFQHCFSVILATNSHSFVFYKFGQMFLPLKDLFFSGVDPETLYNRLRGFAEMGTSYHRLQSFVHMVNNSKGAVFRAFCHSVSRYLNFYRDHIIEIEEQLSNGHSLLSLYDRLQDSADQLRNICTLCKCGSPDTPTESIGNNFPLGVALLSYVFNEAVICHDRNLYLVLVGFLADACQPYLQFVKEWVFRGRCMQSDLQLQINDKFSSNRDRRYWTHYIRAPTCVPTFLQSLYDEIYVCGKTVALMNVINPQHFLVVEGFQCPDIQVTFSRSDLLLQEELWSDHEMKMGGCEETSMMSWLQLEEDAYNSRHEAARNARILGEEHLRKQQSILQERRRIIDQRKRKEFSRMKEEAEEARQRRKQVKEDARMEDHFPQSDPKHLEEAKQELIEHYQQLDRQADKRIAYAKWRNQRHSLDEKRIQHFAQENLYIGTEMKETPKILELSHDMTQDTSASTISQITVESSLATEYELYGGHRRKSTDKNILDSSITDLLHGKVSNDEVVLGKKSVAGENIANSSIDFVGTSTADVVKASTRTVAGQHVTDSSIKFGLLEQKDEVKVGKKSVAGHHVTDSDIIFGAEDTAPQHTGKKSVSGFNVANSSITFDTGTTSTPKYQSTRKVSNFHVSDSNVFAEDTNIQNIRTGRAQVRGQSITESTVFNQDQVQDAVIKPTKQTQGSVSSMQDIIYGTGGDDTHQMNNIPTRKKIASKQITNTTTNGESKWGQPLDLNHVRQFVLHNQAHGGHHSHSTVQDIMYYQADGGNGNKQQPTISNNNQQSLQTPHPTSGRPLHTNVHQSTVQNLIYNTNKPTPNEVLPDVLASIDDFRFTLPAFDHWEDVKNISQELSKTVDSDKLQEKQRTQGYSNDLEILELRPLALLLRQSVIKPIQTQIALANRSILNYFMVDLKLHRHFEMIQHFLFLEDGVFADSFCTQLFEKVHSGYPLQVVLHPVALNDLLSRSINSCAHAKSPLVKNISAGLKLISNAHADTDPQALSGLSLYYDVGWPCNIVITNDHIEHYNRILSFFIKIKHTVWVLHDVTSKLIYIERNIAKYDISDGELRLMHIYQYEMQLFVKVMQGYMSTGVVHVCWDEFQKALKHVHCLDDIYSAHSTYINKCLFRCLLTDKSSVVMSVITDILKSILSFRAKLCSGNISFNNVQRAYLGFAKYSKFLLVVVSKLVDRGYQPHLEDFLTRLNFNGYYNK